MKTQSNLLSYRDKLEYLIFVCSKVRAINNAEYIANGTGKKMSQRGHTSVLLGVVAIDAKLVDKNSGKFPKIPRDSDDTNQISS